MNSIPKAFLWAEASQDLLQILLFRLQGKCHYHRSSLKPALAWPKHYQEAQHDRSKSADAADQNNVAINTTLIWEPPLKDVKDVVRPSSHCNDNYEYKSSNSNHTVPGSNGTSITVSPSGNIAQSLPQFVAGVSSSVHLSSSDKLPGADTDVTRGHSTSSDHGDPQWEVPQGGGPPIAWDPDVAAECERSVLIEAPRPLCVVSELPRQADPAADAELRQLASSGELSAALHSASDLAAAGTPPSFPTLALLADEAARRADPTAFEAARRLAARLYPVNFGRAARLRDSQLELLWRRRLFAPACSLLMRYRTERVRSRLMARRFAICCCLAAREEAEDALPYIQRAVAELMDRGLSGPLLSAWQHYMLSERHSFQEAGRQLLLCQPAARRHLAPYLLHVLQEAQLAGREDVLRRLLELVLGLGETRLYPLVFGALLDFQCLVEDVSSARETFKLIGELSISLPSTVLNRYSSLLQRHRLKAPAALLRMKYRQRPPDSSVAPKPAPPAPIWWDKW